MSQTTYVKYPFGKAEKQSLAYAATVAATINCNESIVTIAQMTGNATVNLTPNPEMDAGANLTIKVSADGSNRTFTPGTSMTGAAVTVTANKSVALTYKYDGSNYVHAGTQQLN